jgi:LysR family transcriptional regulator, glycine cleavage system transcriptional activator
MSKSIPAKSPSPSDLLSYRKALPPFASLRAFEAVGRLGGIRKAATELCVDHAVVSRHLRGLESWFGRPLFDRSGAAPVLNATGRSYHTVITRAILDIAQGTRDLSRLDEAARVLIWCIPGFASRWLAAHVDMFMERHPGIEIEVRPTDSAPNFASDDADADVRFILHGPAASPPANVSLLNFATPPVFPVAAPAWLEANRVETADDLLQSRLLHEENDEQWRDWFAGNGLPIDSHIPGPRLWHAHMAMDAARRGNGVALANAFLVADDLASGQLRVAMPRGCVAVELGSYVFAAREVTLERPAVRKLRHWLSVAAEEFLTRHSAPAARPAPGPVRPTYEAA